MGYFQIIRVDGSSKRYSSMIQMLQSIDREDLETLWMLVKAKHGLIRPEEGYERVLWGDLKVMFEPDVESKVSRNLQRYKVTVWKLFSSSGVHFVRFKNLHIFMLVEKRYPLTPVTITEMLNKKLQADHWNEMYYQLLKLMTKEFKNPEMRFGKKRKLASRYVGPFKILERIGPVVYRLSLPQELSSVHNTFHVSNLKKCLADANLRVPLGEIKVDKTLHFVEEPVEIMDSEVKKLKHSRISIVEVRWNSKRGPEDYMKT
ncbi:hypothetical protein Tco_1075085, partial [Tanacetum coccineum]